MGRSFTCPICGDSKSPIAPGSQFFPFCSERCRDVDLGGWIDGKYKVGERGVEGEDLIDADLATDPDE